MLIPETGEVKLAVNLNLDLFPFGDSSLVLHLMFPYCLKMMFVRPSLGSFEWLRKREAIRPYGFLSIGTGISAGLVLNGHLHRGASGWPER